MKKVHVLWSLFAVLLLAANVHAIDFGSMANKAKEEAEKKAKEEAAKKLAETAENAIKEAYETPQPLPQPQAQPQYQQPQPQYQYPPQQYPPPQYQYPPQQYPPQQVQYKCDCNCGDKADNFTAGERWGTWALNMLIPGLGSAAIMNDWAGMSIQLGLTGLGIVSLVALGEEEVCDWRDSYGRCNRYRTEKSGESVVIGMGSLMANFIFNIARSNSYNKPSQNRYSSIEHSGFNLSALPNRNGEFMPYLMYKRIF